MDDHTRTLLARARAADRDAIDDLFRRYRDRLRHALGKSLGPRYRNTIGGSEDAAHDAILSALGRIHEFEYRGDGSFLAWLLRAAEFEIRNRVRAIDAAKRRAEGAAAERLDITGAPEPIADQTSVSRAAAGAELSERIQQCLAELPRRERDVIQLRRFLQLSWQEVAAELDLPTPDAARVLLTRAQARLAGVMRRRGLEGAS